jgi:hypothetical protein
MNSDLAAKPYPTDLRRRPLVAPRSDEAPRLGEPRLSKRASLMLALLLSLGLWAAIWAAVTTLASMVFPES